MTQTRLLVERLKKEGFQIESISFPDYSTVIGGEIEASLTGRRSYNLQARHMLLALNRWERKADLEKWLSEGKVVVVNRYSGSNYAYGASNGLDTDWLLNLEKGLPEPDLTILLDVSHNISLRRKSTGRDLHERDIPFLERVRREYLKLAERWGWKIVNGERSVEDIHRDVWGAVKVFLEKSVR